MSEHSVQVLETKLDILIGDFQQHRKQSVKQEQIAEIKGAIRLHTVVGGYVLGIISTGITIYLGTLIVG